MYGGKQKEKTTVPVVQILRWQGNIKEWVVIDLVPDDSEPVNQPDKKSKKPREKTELNNVCPRSGATKNCFCFDFKEKAFSVPKCIKSTIEKENPTIGGRIINVESRNNKTITSDHISIKQTKHADMRGEEQTKAPSKYSPMLGLKTCLNETSRKTSKNHSRKSLNPGAHKENRKTNSNSKVNGNPPIGAADVNGTFYKEPTIDGESDKVLKAAFLVTKATTQAVEELKTTNKCDTTVKNIGFRADCAKRPVWRAVVPNKKLNLSKQAAGSNLEKNTLGHRIKTSAEADNIQETMKQSKCDAGKALKKSEKDFILDLLNDLIYKRGRKSATKGEEGLQNCPVQQDFVSEILFADEENQSDLEETLVGSKEKIAVDCALETREEENDFGAQRSWL